jgi:hypothetical protein
MRIKEKIADFKEKHPEVTVKKVLIVSGVVILITTVGLVKIKNDKLVNQIESLMATQGINGLGDDDLSVLKSMYGDVRELDNAALGIAAKGLNPGPTIARATAYERTVLEGLKK